MARSREGSQLPADLDSSRSLGDQIRTVAGVVAVAALLLFFMQNLQEVQMHFLWFDWNTRLIFALFASALVGGLSTWLLGALRRRARRHLPSK